MSYLSINIDNLSNMISEYNNLIEALKGCGDILSQSIGSLSEFEFSGVDAEILREAWGAETYDKIPTIREVLESVKSALEDSLEEYKNCKKYNEEFIVAFDGYGDVCFSAEDMSGNVKCDTSMLSDSSSYCAEIGDIKLDIATSIVSAKNMMAGLNKSQTAISQEIEDFSNLNSKLNQFSLHQFSLSKYSAMMTEADDNLYNKLNAKNFSFTSLYINDGYVPPAVKLMNYSPEAIKCALIISKPVENRTEKEIEFFDSHCNFNSVDYALLMGAIGGAGEDIEWDDLQVKFMANGFLYGLENDDKDLMALFYSYALVETPSSIYFGNDKLGKVLGSLDDTTNPLAYFTLARDLNMHVDKHNMNTEISVIDENGNYVFVLSQYGFDNYGNKDYYRVEKIPFINMYDKIPEEGLYNIRNELHMNHDEEVAFLSSFYSDEDLEHLCELACISKGDAEALEKFFESNTKGVTPAFYTALADYTYHLGEYGTEEYAEQLERVSNSIMTGGGHDGAIMIWDDNASFYYDALYQGFKARFDDANIVTAVDFKISDNDKFVHYGTLSTLFNSEYYMYQNGYNSTTFLGSIAIDFEYNNSDYATIYNNKFTGFTFVDDDKITYSLYFEVTDRIPEPNSVYEFPVTVYGEYNNQQFEDDKIVQNMKNIQWRQTTFPYRAVCAIGSEALGYTKFDEVCPTVSKGGDVLGSISVVKGLYDEYNSFDEDMQKSYSEFFCNKTGWRTGFVIGDLDNDAVPLGNFSPNEKNHVFVVISEPYSPLGYIISEEINNGLLVEDFTEDEKKELIIDIGSKTDDAEKQEVMKSILFGGFDRKEYLNNHSVDEYTSLYKTAIEVYDEKLKKMKGTTLPSSYQSKINERYEELYHN